MRRSIIIILTVLLLLLVAAAGVLFLIRPSVTDMQRQTVEEQLIAMIEDGQVKIETSPFRRWRVRKRNSSNRKKS